MLEFNSNPTKAELQKMNADCDFSTATIQEAVDKGASSAH